MHIREIPELAAYLVVQGPILIDRVRHLSAPALAQYWTASKCRLDRWGRTLHALRTLPPDGQSDSEIATRRFRSVCEEVLVSELLTRVWSSILSAHDVAVSTNESEPIAASVLVAHLEAVNLVLGLLDENDLAAAELGVRLNRLRRICQRWTDLLLGALGPTCDIARFAHDSDRAQEFADDFTRSSLAAVDRQVWNILTASLRATFRQRAGGITANADLNDRIASAILACFPTQIFDSGGEFSTLWMLRMSKSATDTHVLIDELLSTEISSAISHQTS